MNTEISDSNQSVCSVEFIYYFNLWTDKSPVLVICSRVAENLEMQKCLGGTAVPHVANYLIISSVCKDSSPILDWQ